MKPSKEELIDSILDNPAYLPMSGMRKNLKTALTKLSLEHISSLDIIVKQKTWEPLHHTKMEVRELILGILKRNGCKDIPKMMSKLEKSSDLFEGKESGFDPVSEHQMMDWIIEALLEMK